MRTEPSPGDRRRGLPWPIAASAAAVAWAILVAATPARFFAWAAPAAALWLVLSALASPPGLAARLRPTAADLALGLGSGLALYLASRAFLWTFCGGITDCLCGPMAELFERFRPGAPLPTLALFLLVGPAEELFWRGVAQARLAPRLGPLRAVVAAAVLPAALALATGERFLALATVPTYAAWGALAAWRRSLVPALVSHAVWTALIASLAPPI